MLKTESREIMGEEYTVTQYPGTKAMRMAVELGRIVGPAIAVMVDGGNQEAKSITDVKLPPNLLEKAVTILVDRLDADSAERLVKDLARSTRIRQKGGEQAVALFDVFEMQFAGSGLVKLFEWLRFALEVHFKDFLSYLAASGRDALSLEGIDLAE